MMRVFVDKAVDERLNELEYKGVAAAAAIESAIAALQFGLDHAMFPPIAARHENLYATDIDSYRLYFWSLSAAQTRRVNTSLPGPCFYVVALLSGAEQRDVIASVGPVAILRMLSSVADD